MKRFWAFLSVISSIAIVTVVFASDMANLKVMNWPFEGLFGTVDKQAAQRGFQVFKEVCSACHGLNKLSYRNLKNIGFSEDEIKELAKGYTVKDGPNDSGDMFERPAIPSDIFHSPFENEQAARSANNGSYPPDLSLIIKARHDGANYLYSLLTGYNGMPSNFKLQEGMHYNEYFPGKQIGMPAPLSDGMVTYSDGTHASIEQMSSDLVVFLQWVAEPEMEHRKSLGLKAMIFLGVFTILFYISKQRTWKNVT
jgi:ubiquinol-cytochrome c reductase cytochrome c1 subunit